jgi:hypothetical protein
MFNAVTALAYGAEISLREATAFRKPFGKFGVMLAR